MVIELAILVVLFFISVGWAVFHPIRAVGGALGCVWLAIKLFVFFVVGISAVALLIQLAAQ